MLATRNSQLETRDFGFSPLSQAASLRELIARRNARQSVSRTRTIALASAQPGVGKTTLAVNLAAALHKGGQRVVLLDLAQGPSNASALLGLEARAGFEQVLLGERALRDIALAAPCGLRVIPAGSGVEGLANLTPWQQERLWHGLAELGQGCDVVVTDGAAGAGPGVLAAAEVVVVTLPEANAVADAYGLVKLLSQHKPGGRLHLVVNRCPSPGEARRVARCVAQMARRFLGVEVNDLGMVPEDPHVPLAAQEGAPLVVAHPRSPAARGMAAVAARLRGAVGKAVEGSLTGCVRQLATLVARREPDGPLGLRA
jgi:flagellar biosynthesis protein FlhG